MKIPVSRVYSCFLEGPENPQSEACKAAIREGGKQALYDWNGVNRLANGGHREIIPDGTMGNDDDPDEDLFLWEAGTIYVAGDEVVHRGLTYHVKWWTQGDEPFPDPTFTWETPWEWESTDNNPIDPPGFENSIWKSTAVYIEGDMVTHAGHRYIAKWWNLEFPPDTSVTYAWETPWELIP